MSKYSAVWESNTLLGVHVSVHELRCEMPLVHYLLGASYANHIRSQQWGKRQRTQVLSDLRLAEEASRAKSPIAENLWVKSDFVPH